MFTIISIGKYPDKGVFCVYFLKRDGKVLYVGQTKSMELRMYKHRHDKRILFDCIEYTITSKFNVNNLETHYIMHYSPFYNSSLPANDYFKPVGNLKSLVVEEVEKHILNKTISIGNNSRCKYIASADYNKILSSIKSILKPSELIALSE